ncbi:hypothetical protein EXT46_11095 [Pseudoalteromonas sp. CO325X]|uniref:hypothetical protein n=1 Tax=Pseudoalteromonas sp. CO325X TaxID=1777262 RepID=UPI00102365CC|nr:hypothetical protein [Pseudoalteromonas sp. CO325X]RZF80556.1 hypothetical protein EXT46_11095 [Pseudoalteromonas sp. CO325X]
MKKRVHLRKFSPDELIFNEDETITILKFIFKKEHTTIEHLQITDPIREFAQALLVEAVDASYALGFVDILFRTVSKPSSGAKKVIIKFGSKALKHWFKHATANDLMSIKIYDRVVDQLAANFVRVLQMHAAGIAKLNDNHFGVLLLNDMKSAKNKVVWA